MTAVKDPCDRSAGLGCVPRAVARRQAQRAHLRTLVRGQHARLGAAALAEIRGAAAAPASLWATAGFFRAAPRSSWTAAAARARHGSTRPGTRIPRARRRQLGLSVRSIPTSIAEQVRLFHRRRRDTWALTRSAIAPSIGWSTPTRRCSRRRRPRLQAQHHSRQYSDRSCDRDHGDARDEIRCGLPGGAGAFHVVDRRYLCRKFRAAALAALGTAQDLLDKGIHWGGGSDYPVTPAAGALRTVGLGRAGDA